MIDENEKEASACPPFFAPPVTFNIDPSIYNNYPTLTKILVVV